MTKFLAIGLSLFVSASAFAGSANTEVKCKSADGKVTLEGDVPGDHLDFTLTAKIGTGEFGEIKLYSGWNQEKKEMESNATISVVEDFKNGVYTVVATDGDLKTIELYAIPKTLKVAAGNGLNTSFTGQLTVDSENGSVKQTVQCTTSYSI